MRRLWTDAKAHKVSAALVIAYWLMLVCLDVFGWRKPDDRDDMLTSVVYLILFSAVLAGGVVAWWRRLQRRQVSGGMLAGGVLLALAAAAIVVPQMVRSEQDGESMLEFPVLLLIVGLLGALLGLIGAGTTTGVLRLFDSCKPDNMTVPPSAEERPSARRMRIVAAAIALAAALTIAVGIIPPVAADVYPGAAPGRASKAFGANSAVNVALALVLLAPYVRRRTGATRTILTVTAFVALLLGFMLLSAVGIGGHGQALFVAAVASGVCAVADLAVAALTFRLGRSM